MNKTIVISPSGNFYGSEQVLYDFLCNSEEEFSIFVPSGSLFKKKLSAADTHHEIRTFDAGHLLLFYGRLSMLLLSGMVKCVYLNEAGHSKFILLLAKLFTKKNFVIHVRMMEDAAPSRWATKKLPNVRVISISEYIRERLTFPSELIYDPYCFISQPPVTQKINAGRLVIGIIGRITATKGIGKLLQLLEYSGCTGPNRSFVFHLYGDPSETDEDKVTIERLLASSNVAIKGFVQEKNLIYENIDCVLHLSEQEALGRIFFEAIDYGKPFIGFDAAGIKEIGRLSGLNELLVAPGQGWEERMIRNLCMLDENYVNFTEFVKKGKDVCMQQFSINGYVKKINELIV